MASGYFSARSRVEIRSARIPVLVNDRAGAFSKGGGKTEIERLANERGLALDIIGAESPEQTQSLLRDFAAADEPVVALAGGDGTIHLAVQVLARTNTALAILPQGTANNFASALGLPLDLPSAMEVLTNGAVQQVDLGSVCGEYFTESAGVGLFADALALYGQGVNKNVWRGLRAILKLILSLRASRLKLTVDGERIVERAVMCAAANSFRMGYALPIAPEAELDDSQLDVVILGDLKRSELLQYFRAIRAQTHPGLPKVQSLRGRRIQVESRRRLLVHADDRLVCTTPATIEVQPRALKVVVPNRDRNQPELRTALR